MAVQKVQAHAPNTTLQTLSATFPSSNTAGNCIAVFVAANSFGAIDIATFSDSLGNVYTKQEAFTNNNKMWLYTAVNILGGANTITVTTTSSPFTNPLAIYALEGPASSAVRVHNQNTVFFGTLNMTVSLAGTLTGDYTAAIGWQTDAATLPTVGNIGTNPATNELSFSDAIGGSGSYLVEDGSSSGGTISVTETAIGASNGWGIIAVSFIPSSVKSNAIFFGTE